jgi:hypothetical protein
LVRASAENRRGFTSGRFVLNIFVEKPDPATAGRLGLGAKKSRVVFARFLISQLKLQHVE